jgi:hypothetical protein
VARIQEITRDFNIYKGKCGVIIGDSNDILLFKMPTMNTELEHDES